MDSLDGLDGRAVHEDPPLGRVPLQNERREHCEAVAAWAGMTMDWWDGWDGKGGAMPAWRGGLARSALLHHMLLIRWYGLPMGLSQTHPARRSQRAFRTDHPVS